MAARHLTSARDDPSRPPMFSAEEWRRIVQDLALSPRQAEVIGYVMQSKKDKEIATAMQISKATVRTYFDRCKQQMNAIDRVAIACRIFETFRRQS
ncbi:MAG: hypothetical protein KF861_01400 [Planctomycetaceae bacterium]|nr:hypothetical protein [Planctomycetaceae bacterium]